MFAIRRRLRTLTLVLSLAAVFAAISVVPASAGTTQSGYQILKNVDSAKCMDDPYGSRSAGVQMIQWTCNQQANQTWNFIFVDGYRWMIQNQWSGLCLDVWQARYQNGTKVVQWPCDGGDYAESFVIQASGTPCSWAPNSSYYHIYPYAKTSMVVELYGQGSANGMKIDIWQYWGGFNQAWYNC